jgi:hypothetical protein
MSSAVRLTLLLACSVIMAAPTFAADGALGSRGAAGRSGVIDRGDLPGGRWSFPLRDEQLGRVGKAFAAAHGTCTDGAPRESGTPKAVDARFYSRLGRGLSLSASLVVVFPNTHDPAALFHASLSSRGLGCIARTLTGSRGGARVEAWVVPSPLARIGRTTRAARIAVRYVAGDERWSGSLDFVETRLGATWALYVFFASEASTATGYEQALLADAVARLGAARSTQAATRRTAQAATSGSTWRETVGEAIALDERALELAFGSKDCYYSNPLPNTEAISAALQAGALTMSALDAFRASVDAGGVDAATVSERLTEGVTADRAASQRIPPAASPSSCNSAERQLNAAIAAKQAALG